jgi:cytochrome c oxidase assembly protein subunit 15
MTAVVETLPDRIQTRALLTAEEPRLVLHVMSWVCMAMLAGLLFLGALVTSFKVGMAVPDGTTTFGQTMWLYRWWDKAFGVQLEHTHRLAGMYVGLAILTIYLTVFFTSPRARLRWTATAALGAVIVQGLLGAYRVDLNEWIGETYLAPIHGAWAQVVAMLVVALVAMTSRWWTTCEKFVVPANFKVRELAVTLVGLSYVQIVIGALFRHRSVGFHLHAAVGYLLLAAIMGLGAYILVNETVRRRLGWPLFWVAVCVVAQIVLGNASALATGLIPRELRPEITNLQAFTTAAHLLVGSWYFAATIVLALVAYRGLQPMEARP